MKHLIPLKPLFPKLDCPTGWAAVFLVMFVIGSALSLLGCCSSPPLVLGPGGPVSRASVVTLVRPTVVERNPSLLQSLEGEGSTAAYKQLVYVPSCNAFAVERGGTVYLVTAEHCVEDVKIGGMVRYMAPNGVGHGFARLTMKDEAHDRAMLTAMGNDLEPLREAAPPGPGAHTVAVSSFFEAVTGGVVIAELAPERWGTSQSIGPGWSGSPELDSQGRVWGIISQCPTRRIVVVHTEGDAESMSAGEAECRPGEAIAVGLP